MKITLITPDFGSSRNGNSMTAVRYAGILRGLGHSVNVLHKFENKPADLMIALHARRSYESIREFKRANPSAPLIVVLTGTDLYRDIHSDRRAEESLQHASRLVVLQKRALDEIPADFRSKTSVIYQSAEPYNGRAIRPSSYFRVAVVANLREEKDPLRAALAARLLPASSRIRVIHIGCAMSQRMRRGALNEMRVNRRYRWLGEAPHWKARRLIAASHLVAITSRIEGSSNVLSEALASKVPVLASRIPGLEGTVGARFPGCFPAGDTHALASLMYTAESDPRFYDRLSRGCARIAPLVKPEAERKAWRRLLAELD